MPDRFRYVLLCLLDRGSRAAAAYEGILTQTAPAGKASTHTSTYTADLQIPYSCSRKVQLVHLTIW